MTTDPGHPASPTSARPLLVVLLALVVVSMEAARPPAALPASAPAERFSAARAMVTVHDVARAPRLPGGEAHGLAVQRLVEHVRALGLPVELQRGELHGWELTNLIVRAPTTGDGGDPLLLMAHHDSVRAGPGAGDDASGVAALLEVLRALLTDAPGPGAVTLLITDGEEQGLLGARMFVDAHPEAHDVAAVVNIEGRGCGGPSTLFELGPGSGPLLSLFARVAPHPFGSSLAPAVYARMPNDTDLSPFRDAGRPGLNMAFFAGGDVYHTAHDQADRLDPDSVQHHGANVLALARAWRAHGAGVLDGLPALDAGAVFTSLPGLGMVAVDRHAVDLALLLLSLLGAAGLVRAWRRRGPVVLRGGLLVLLGLVLAVALPAALVWGAASAAAGGGPPHGNVAATTLASAGAWAVQLGLLLAFVRWVPADRAAELAHGSVLLAVLLAVGWRMALPDAAHVPAVVLLSALLGEAASRGGRPWLAAAALLPAGLVLGPQVPLLGHVGSVAPAWVGLLAAGAAAPLALAAGPVLAAVGRNARSGAGALWALGGLALIVGSALA